MKMFEDKCPNVRWLLTRRKPSLNAIVDIDVTIEHFVVIVTW